MGGVLSFPCRRKSASRFAAFTLKMPPKNTWKTCGCLLENVGQGKTLKPVFRGSGMKRAARTEANPSGIVHISSGSLFSCYIPRRYSFEDDRLSKAIRNGHEWGVIHLDRHALPCGGYCGFARYSYQDIQLWSGQLVTLLSLYGYEVLLSLWK